MKLDKLLSELIPGSLNEIVAGRDAGGSGDGQKSQSTKNSSTKNKIKCKKNKTKKIHVCGCP